MRKILFKSCCFLSLLPLLAFGLFEPLKGNWTSGGQTIRFDKGNQCQWILSYNGKSDTFNIAYHYEKTGKQTGILDLGPFDRGILKGKTLYGIVEWADGKNAFRYDAEPGKSSTVRPTSINPEQVQLYKKIK